MTADELKEFFNPEQLTQKEPSPEEETQNELANANEEDMWKELMQEIDVNGDGKVRVYHLN